MRVGLVQVNPTIGDLAGNVERCLRGIAQAREDGAELIVLPELAIPGAGARDILYDPSFVQAVEQATDDLAQRAEPDIPVIVGSIIQAEPRTDSHPGLANIASIIADGCVRHTVSKQHLASEDVAFEHRWFVPGSGVEPLELAGRRIGVLVGNDLYSKSATELISRGADLLVCIAASHFEKQRPRSRLEQSRSIGVPMVWVNLCGANDELIYDGHSFVLDERGRPLALLSGFTEEVRVFDLDHSSPIDPSYGCWQEEVFAALVTGIRDFARKNRIRKAVLGLSGGIDSALVAVIATAALGPENVTAVAVPSRYSDPRSTSCARELATSLGIGFEVVELDPLHKAAEQLLGDLMQGGTAAENVQARLRMTVLMSYVNRHSGMLLNTSNKTELSLGYGTLYGDLAGSLSPIGDLTKPEVQELARWASVHQTPIPEFILERPPSAELRENQVDPFDYAKVGPELESLIRKNRSNAVIARSEHKRWQSGVILKVSQKSFGSGRLIPLTRR
jgi:NAD+ synthetase